MRKTAYLLLGAALFLGSAPFALAAQLNPDLSDVTSPQPFSFSCDPYTAAFAEGQAYIPTENGTCIFAIPQTSTPKFMAIYQGTPGHASLLFNDFGVDSSSFELFDMSGTQFGTPQPGDAFFAVSVGGGDPNAANTYFTTGAGAAPADYSIVNWHWGAPVTVTADNKSISVGDALPALTATISGFIGGDTLTTSGITGAASCTTTAAGSSVAGDYPITCTRGTLSSGKYAFDTFVAGTLHIAAPSDTQPPVVVIATPADGSSYLQNDTVFISATATDTSGIASTTYTLNGGAVDPNAPLPLMSQPLGTAVLVASSTDPFGNTGYATSTFTILPPDLTPPTITITSPQNGATYFDTDTVLLTASVADASPIAATSYTFNGATIDPSKPLPLLGAPLGTATVSVSATDAYGNAASSTVTFTIKSSDITPPTITVTNPVAGNTYLSTDTVVPSVSVTDASGIATSSYTLDNIPVDPTQALPLSTVPAGSATFSVSATDNFGNATTTNIVFTITAPPAPDTAPPTITITSPVSGRLYSRSDTVMLAATITDQSAIARTLYYFDGKPVDPSKPLPLLTAPLGNASTTVVATDAFGNTASQTVNFRIVPAIGNCEEEIIDAFNHKFIPNKGTFSHLFADCRDLYKFGRDRDDSKDNDDQQHKSYDQDGIYQQAQINITKAYADIDSSITR
ncbi:MAG: hypothetical protein KGH79_04875 [Patescibacteria group bacterium]|nr:hypothetical protein [Patescibacteria group bacterium]